MTVFGIGVSYGVATLFAMFSGMPIAFALGAVAVVFMGIYMPTASLDTVTQNVYEEMASITLLSIPLFILKGAAIGKSRAGQDLYSALHAWLHRIPGGLGVANVFACRSDHHSVFRLPFFGNPLILWGVFIELLLLGAISYTALGNQIFGTSPLPLWIFGPLAFGAVILLFVEEVRKHLARVLRSRTSGSQLFKLGTSSKSGIGSSVQ